MTATRIPAATEFAEWLKRMRANAGMTQDDLSAATGLARQTIGEFEGAQAQDRVKRAHGLPIGYFVRIADALNLDLGYMLTKAGYDLGASGVKTSRLKRVEDAAEFLVRSEARIRQGLAEGVKALEDRERLSDAQSEKAVGQLGMALAAFDLVLERLRADGFVSVGGGARSRSNAAVRDGSGPHGWTGDDIAFLRSHAELPDQEIGEYLGRSSDAIRAARQRHLAPEEERS